MPTTSYTSSTFSANVIGARTDAAGAAVTDLSAEEARLPAVLLNEGYITPSTAFKVQAQTVPDMTVKVGSGTAKADYYVVAGDVAGQGNYVVRLDVASQNVTIDAADASQPRTDEIYLVVRDNVYDTSARGLPQIGYRKGDLGGANPGPDPAWKASALLARVAVAAAATTITSGNITDLRAAGGLGGSSIPLATVDAKGDLIAATAADMVARLPVGTDGQVLTADSTQSTGLAWEDAPTGSAVDYLTANETVTNSTTLVASGLSLPVAANATYLVEAVLFYGAPTAADIKFGRTYPSGTTGVLAAIGLDVAATSGVGNAGFLGTTDMTIPTACGGTGSTTAFPIVSRLEGLIITAGSSGSFTITFAQNVANASATTLCAGSWLRLTRVA